MKVKDFDYDLPEELIAQDPLEKRSNSRLMVLDKNTGETFHRHFYDIKDYLKPGDCLVINNTKVIPARLYGARVGSGGKVEILLLKRISDNQWECLVKPGKKARPGMEISFGDGLLMGKIIDIVDEGNRIIEFSYEGIFEEILDRLGETPLPPYIHEHLDDAERYQTVYNRVRGSAAAPTAGLHFTQEQLDELKNNGINLGFITLHVGLGTFRPVRVDTVEEHKMHEEFYSIPQSTVELINQTKLNQKRVIAVGTTSIRTLESFARSGLQSGSTDIFIYPGFQFKVVDALITNFHLPKSTLLMLISAFAGREFVLKAYREAIKERYRFFSFGDAMFIEEKI